jgi:hypothetical protein
LPKNWRSRSSRFFFCWRDWEVFWSCQTSGEARRTFRESHSAFLRSKSKKAPQLFELAEVAVEACFEVGGEFDVAHDGANP